MGQRRDELLTRATLVPELLARVQQVPVPLKAQGVRVYDVDNIGYIDYLGGGGAAIVGYANQYLLDAVRKVLVNGVPDGVHVAQEVELAEDLQQHMPWAGSWWFCRTSNEAVRALLAWVRRTTGKEIVVVLDGGGALGVGRRTSGQPDALSVREVPGWDLDRIEAAVSAGASKIAAVVVRPSDDGGRARSRPRGRPRRHRGGLSAGGGAAASSTSGSPASGSTGAGAAARFGVMPDARCTGARSAAVSRSVRSPSGRASTRRPWSDDGRLPAPHPVSLAAAEAVLSILRNDTTYERLEERREQLVERR